MLMVQTRVDPVAAQAARSIAGVLTEADVSAAFGLNEIEPRRAAAMGILPATRGVNGELLFLKADIEAMVRSGELHRLRMPRVDGDWYDSRDPKFRVHNADKFIRDGLTRVLQDEATRQAQQSTAATRGVSDRLIGAHFRLLGAARYAVSNALAKERFLTIGITDAELMAADRDGDTTKIFDKAVAGLNNLAIDVRADVGEFLFGPYAVDLVAASTVYFKQKITPEVTAILDANPDDAFTLPEDSNTLRTARERYCFAAIRAIAAEIAANAFSLNDTITQSKLSRIFDSRESFAAFRYSVEKEFFSRGFRFKGVDKIVPAEKVWEHEGKAVEPTPWYTLEHSQICPPELFNQLVAAAF